jgi:glycosyltransferase involved in cell wall biosynthesis
MEPPFSSLFLHGPSYSYLPFERLCRIYDQQSRWQEAIENGLKVLRVYPRYEQMMGNIRMWKANMNINPNKPNLLVLARGQTFIKPMCTLWTKDYNVVLQERFHPDLLKFVNQPGDIIFFEWCDSNIIEASHVDKPAGVKYVCRLHSYESHTSQPDGVEWDKVDTLMFVADHIKRRCEKRYDLKKVPIVTIPNGVDYQNYSFAIRKPGPNFAFVGIFSWKKGIQGLIMTLHWLKKYMPDFTLHARVDFFEGDASARQAADYWDFKYPELKNNIKFYPRREAMLDGWLEDMHFMLSVSTVEAFSYYIAEGMCKGIKPLIYDWEGAREIWGNDNVWNDFDDLKTMIEGPYDSRKYRDYVVKNFGRPAQMTAIKKLFTKLRKEGLGEAGNEGRS